MPYIECHHCNKIIHNVSILKDITLNLDRNKIYGLNLVVKISNGKM